MNRRSRSKLTKTVYDARKWGALVREMLTAGSASTYRVALETGLSRHRAGNLVQHVTGQVLEEERAARGPPPEPEAPEPTADDLVEGDRRARRATEDLRELRRRYDALHAQHERAERELGARAAVMSGAGPVVVHPSPGRPDGDAVALAVASDWHVEEEVRAATVNGRNRYDLDVARTRAARFFDGVVRCIRKEKQDARVRTLVLALLGDFISGRIHEELLETCLLRPVEAAVYAQSLLEGGIRSLLELTELDLVVPCLPGNHSRITRRVHAATEAGNSLETFIYQSLAQRFENEPRVRFILDESYHTYLDVLGRTLRLHHGHEVRYQGGVGGLTIPLNKAVAQWDGHQRSDFDACGHWHSYMPARRYLVNGSLIGVSAFSIRIKATYEPPIQGFALVHGRHGVTTQSPILVGD